MQKTIMQLVARAERVVERHRREIRKVVSRARGLVKTRLVSFWESLSIILSLFTCESTEVYRVLKDKSTRREHQMGNSRLALNMDLKDKRQNIRSTELCDFSFRRK